MGYSSGHHFLITQKHTFLSQTKHTGLAACVSAKHPLLLQWNLSEITAYMKNTVPQKLMPYKKLCYLNCSHSLPPWKRPWQAPKACLCLSYQPTQLPQPLSPRPVQVLPLCLLECLGWEAPSQLGYQDKSEWGSSQLCLGRWEASSPPHLWAQPTRNRSTSRAARQGLKYSSSSSEWLLLLPRCSRWKSS